MTNDKKWVIAGKQDQISPTIGAVYEIRDSRKMSKTRLYILSFINNHAGFRLANVQNKTATAADENLLAEALGFRSLCLYSGLSDAQLKQLWDDSGLEYSL